MGKLRSLIPNSIRLLFNRIFITLGVMTLTRIVFYFVNSDLFPNAHFSDFITGIWFDIVTCAILFLPYAILFLTSSYYWEKRWHQLTFRILFILILIFVTAANLTDVAYYPYTLKRSTVDLFDFLGTGNDIKQLVFTLLSEFWYLFVLLILFIWGIIAFDKFILRRILQTGASTSSKKKYILYSILSISMLIILSRGGIQYRPIGILNANTFTSNQNVGLVLNTPFTLIKTIGKEQVEEKHYFNTIAETEKYFNPIITTQPSNLLNNNQNVVVLILESFGAEFIGHYHDSTTSYTPFLDSLLDESISYQYAFANGKKSIEAASSIFASIPSWMETPFISSPYSTNKIEGLPDILKKYGYSSAFYHGATNGSMQFDAFASKVGFEEYYGRIEYDNEKHYDGTWGILDEFFNPWAARKMSELKEPFFSSLFTVSSHHPYYIPEKWKSIVKRGPQEMCASINYADHSLKLFFEEAKKQPWYENTLFVICADHTPASKTRTYLNRTHLYRIPIAYYHPSGQLPKGKSTRITQQLDMLPTILELLNIQETIYAYGTSSLQATKGEATSYLQGNFFYYFDQNMITFNQSVVQNLYNFASDNPNQVDSLTQYKTMIIPETLKLKAMIQRYNHDLRNNQMTIK